MRPTTPDLRQRRALMRVEPRSADQLDGWLRLALGLDVPRHALVDGHAAPFAYLHHAFFGATPRDCVVWAARGAGKTFYAAVATLLDMLFRPGIEVRLLGGSLEQSRRMHEHLAMLFGRPELAWMIARPAARNLTARRVRLVNGSRAEILAQSHTSVRGARPQVLRCDEVELFDPEVWRAAQFMTRSKRCGDVLVPGAVEALSTWHLPHGLMASLVGDALAAAPRDRTLFRWGIVDVLQRCEIERSCSGCGIADDCKGRARTARGHVHIDDALAIKSRSDRASWEAEMMCLRPKRSDAVFPEFDRVRHVRDASVSEGAVTFIAGMDFGFRAPTVIVFATVDARDVVHVLDEHVASGIVIEQHIEAIRRSTCVAADGLPEWIGVDPAGHQRNEQTGVSTISVLRKAGIVVRTRPTALDAGLRIVRARLAPAASDAPPRLFIHPRCTRLIESLEAYHYPAHRPDVNVPVKDGPDHAVDALRYMLVNIEARPPVRMARYV